MRKKCSVAWIVLFGGTTSSIGIAAASFVCAPRHQQLANVKKLTHPFTKLTQVSLAVSTHARPIDEIHYKPALLMDDLNEDGVPEFDSIVIGSGIGGLATASLLSQKGNQKVLVLEQHYKIGGCLHTFERKGYKFAIGIHYVGEIGATGPTATGFDAKNMLDTVAPATSDSGTVEWTRMPDSYDTVCIGKERLDRKIEIYADVEQEKLKEQFPDEIEAIDKYFDECKKALAAIKRGWMFKALPVPFLSFCRRTGLIRLFDRGYHKYSKLSLKDVVESLTSNKELQTILMYNWGDYGCLPSETPFLLHGLVKMHYANGGYYPSGGPDAIAKKIIPAITAKGGKVLAKAPVKQIVIEDGKAIGVELQDGTLVRAKEAVISDAGLINTCLSLLPPSLEQEAMIQRFKLSPQNEKSSDVIVPSMTGLNLFVGLRGDNKKDLHLPTNHLWLYSSPNMEQDLAKLPDTIDAKTLDNFRPYDFSPVFIGSPSGKDGDWKKMYPNKSALEIIAPIRFSWFEKYAPDVLKENTDGTIDPGGKPGAHGEEYKKIKEQLAELLWQRTRQGLVENGASEQLLPRTLSEADVYELGTPLTYAHYLRSAKGGFYGVMSDISRFEPKTFCEDLRPEVREIPGLYLTGQDISVIGVMGALASAYICAGKILGARDPFSLANRPGKDQVDGDTGTFKKPSLVQI